VLDRIRELEALVDPNRREPVSAARERLERSTFVLAVVGEFSSGKSFLLNALLGEFRFEEQPAGRRIAGLLATDINPSTATITELEYAGERSAYAVYPGGRTERIPLDRLSRFIAVASSTGQAGAVHDATQDEQGAPERVVVRLDSEFLARGFTVADTPGLASINPAHRRATLGFLPTADAVLYVIDTQQPFTEGDASFLGLIRQHLDTIFIVQTKIDLWESLAQDGRPMWASARDRITQLAAVHAPGTYVYAVSARQYVEGTLENDNQLIDRSQFRDFVAALDASLVRTTGRARLQRARDQAGAAALEEIAQLQRDREMVMLDGSALERRRAEAQPQIAALASQAAQSAARVDEGAARIMHAVGDLSLCLQDEAQQALERAFDAADIARLQDRARLHILIDRTMAQTVQVFADQVSTAIFQEYARAAAALPQELRGGFSFAGAAAAAFGDPGSSTLWTEDPQRALCAAIVLQSLGGPSITLAHEISTRFAAARTGTYMKRELTADLRATIWPMFQDEMQRFCRNIVQQLPSIAQAFTAGVERALGNARDRLIGSIDRALEIRASPQDPAAAAQTLQQREDHLASVLMQMQSTVDDFLQRGTEIAVPQAGSEAVRRSHVDREFDREAYRQGLRPQRWRVTVLGALRRGKSSLINAFAGRRVLADEVAGAIAYPVHVRYGEREGAFALQPTGEWREVEIESALEEAARNPVLILTPWNLPRELVLVHAPAFDAGDSTLEDVCVVAAREASEVLCLFSRQLSDRELSLYERVAALGKPMMFAHTLADNESAAERREVVELAQQYLRARNINLERTFVVSTLEYAQAKREGRAPAGWNELDALIATVTAHAEEHMARLARLERAASPVAAERLPEKRRGLLARLFRR
jgi:predicted GTPase